MAQAPAIERDWESTDASGPEVVALGEAYYVLQGAGTTEPTGFLASQRIATFREEADRDRLAANARQPAANATGWPPTRQRRRFERLVARAQRLARPIRRPTLGRETY